LIEQRFEGVGFDLEQILFFLENVLKVAMLPFPFFDLLMVFGYYDVKLSDVLILAFHHLERLFVSQVQVNPFKTFVFQVQRFFVVQGHVLLELNDFVGQNGIVLGVLFKKLISFLLEFFKLLFVDLLFRSEFLIQNCGFGVKILV
jgi:hypothetical protein